VAAVVDHKALTFCSPQVDASVAGKFILKLSQEKKNVGTRKGPLDGR
jgi:hypothetical protein